MNIKNEHEQSGEIYHISPTEIITPNLEKKVITIRVPNGNRNEFIPFEFYNPTRAVESLGIGNKIHVTYKLKGNESKKEPGKFFPSNEAINVIKL